MRVLKYILVSILALSIIVALFLYVYLQNTKPDYRGELSLKSLEDNVTIYHDEYGVPHIYAENAQDAHIALGYVHAQERLFQMEMIRRVTKGKLSEILGPEFVKTDKLFRTLGILETARLSADEDLKNQEQSHVQLALAYQKGVNEFVSSGPTPIEFTLMGIEKSEFTFEDMYLVVGFMSVGFAEALKTDPVLTFIKNKYGENYLEPLAIGAIPDTKFIPSFGQKNHDEFSQNISQALNNIPISMYSGSNGWVIAPEKSKTGTPLFANDTHIGFSQPSVWFEAHLNYPGHSLYGNYAAGFPFALLGHNNHTAWGLTMFENDDMDFFVEKPNPENNYQVMIDSAAFTLDKRPDTIAVKGEDPVIFEILTSPHGPVINQVLSGFPTEIKEPVSMWWEFTSKKSKLLEAAWGFNTAQDIYDIQKAASLINAPGVNVMTADTKGNIAWFAAASLVQRPRGSVSSFFLNGNDQLPYQNYYPTKSNPHSINPPWHYVYSANNQPDTVDGNFYQGYYLPEDRAMRIVELIESKDKWSLEDMKEMNLDHTSVKDRQTAQYLGSKLETFDLDQKEKEVVARLMEWKGTHKKDQIEPTIYYSLLSNIIYEAMADEIGEDRFSTFNSCALMKRSYFKFLSTENSPWWDNTKTEQKESQQDIFEKALRNVISTYTEKYGEDINLWQWGKVHTLTHGHPLGTVELFAPYFNVGPFPVQGGSETINNLMFDLSLSGDFPVKGGPALRKLIDLGDINNAQSILPTGQSGNFLSPHYDDQGFMFANGQFRKLYFNKEDVLEQQPKVLELKAENE